jgi:hypothetical protein
MAIADFQRALADMTLDVRLAASVRRLGADALSQYNLTDRERRRLAAVARQDGMSVNCSLARANRFGGIHDAFPMTCTLLMARLKDLLDDLWSGRRPDNYQLAGEEGAFAQLLDHRLGEGGIDDEYAEEVFRYEHLCWTIAAAMRVREASDMEGHSGTVAFRHDPAPVLDALSRHERPPAGLPKRDHVVTVRVQGGDIVASWAPPGTEAACV